MIPRAAAALVVVVVVVVVVDAVFWEKAVESVGEAVVEAHNGQSSRC